MPPHSIPGRIPALLALTLVGAPLLSAPLGAQEGSPADPFLVPGFVVTPTRTAVPADRTPTPVTILTGDELRAAGIRTVADALRSVPGMQVVRAGTAGAQTSLFLRGGQSNHVRVLVDGVPVNEAGGAIDLADLSADQVERIEVVRGPASVLYGSEAVAGVVQIFTSRGRGAPTLEISALGGVGERRQGSGQYGLSDVDATLSGRTGAISWMAGGARSSSAGAYPMNNERLHHAAHARVGWLGGDGGSEVALSIRLTDSETGLPTDGAGNLVDENAALDRRLFTASLQAGQSLGERLHLHLQLGRSLRDQVSRDEPDSPADTLGVFRSRLASEVARTSAELRFDVTLPRSVLSVGGGWEETDGNFSYTSDGEFGPWDAEAEYARANRSAYLQLLAEPLSGMHLTAGVRLDDNETFGRFATHRVGISWLAWEGGRLRAAVGRAFREPTFAEHFGSGFGDLGNPDLVPERSRSHEAGAEQSIGDLVLAVTRFEQRFEDMIQYTFTAPEPGGPNYFNVGSARAAGWEWTAEGGVGAIRLTGSFTRLGTRVLDPGLATDATFVEGASLVRRPRNSGSIAARLPLERGSVGAAVTITGARDDLDFGSWPAPRITLPRYTTLDLHAEHALPEGLPSGARILLRVENALDATFEAVAGFPAPGRVVRLGVRVGVGG